MGTAELKSCPFCGGEAKFLFRKLEGVGIVIRVGCKSCLAKSPAKRSERHYGWHETLVDAADAWNRRAKDENA